MYGNNAWNDRESPSTALTPATAANLQPAWDYRYPISGGGNETYPIEVGGVLYATDHKADVYALDATTGRLLWSYRPTVHLLDGIPLINRGVAVASGRVYVLTADDQLVALNAATGKVAFTITVAAESVGYFESMAPIVANGRVLVGSSGGDEGVRGFLAAYDAQSGSRLWKFYTVPERGTGWMPATGDHGGGAVWTTPAFDPLSGHVYFGTGNPSPDYFGATRPGPNPYTDSVVRLAVNTGALSWYGQEVTHDLWDYDVASPPLLFPLGNQLAVGEAGKNGYWYEWNAETGKPLTAPLAFVKEDHQPPTASGTKVWPGSDGGANYGPSAYDVHTHEAFIAGINGPETLYGKASTHAGYRLDLGTGQNPAPTGAWSGTITAVDVRSGTIVWQRHLPTPAIGGVTATAGGVVLYGAEDGTLVALSASTGQTVWTAKTGAPIGSAPIVYTVHGATYVAVATGGASSLASLYPWSGANHVVVYRLSNQQEP